ncbi:thioesterase family protein [Saccharothrix sp. HUAS TT1]|uniref:thioesterase family protein n=1 Tax=unclassified Saccharothrix TaxID=2593673 RepID=UPI00345B5C18
MTATLDAGPTTYVGRPRYEGANIRTWIGFKHFTYLLEEAVLQHFRDRGIGPDALYHRHGLGIEFVETSIQLPATLLVDDEVTATVVPAKAKPGHGAAFTVRLGVRRDDRDVTVLTGKVRIALVAEKDAPGHEPVPVELVPFVVSEVAELESAASVRRDVECAGGVADVLTPAGSNAFLWSWRIPYFYCHFSLRFQHSGYTRALEEVVDRFLHERGLGIGKLLDERGWIPVVSRARVRLLADAHMEETLHTVFTVEEILKDVMYTARMDTYVRRGDTLVHTATASIVHGYAVSRGENAGSLAEFDPETRAALLGGDR